MESEHLRKGRRTLCTSAKPVTSRRVRVAIVAPALTILGGQAVQADRLLKAWRGDPDVDAWLVPVNPLPPGPLRHLTRLKYLRTVITQLTYWPLLLKELRRADVVHVFSASYFSFLLAPTPAALIAWLYGRPVLLNYRSGEAPDHLARSRFARAILARTDINVVPSAFLQGVFEHFGLTARVVHNIVDLREFQYRRRRPLRPRLLSTRNLESLYNVACTLRAFRLVQDRYADATLTVVGSGSQEAALKRLAGELGLRGVVFAGRVPHGEISRHYEAADIYVQTPNIDNMPASVLEAYAAGLPAVSTDAGGVPTILTHERHGLLAPIGDHEAIAAQVLRLLDDPGLAEHLTEEALRACEVYRWHAVRSEWLSIYREALQRRNPALASAGAAS